MTPLLVPLLSVASDVIGRLLPDPAQRAAAELELAKLHAEGALKPLLAQLDINAREAQHASIFVSGWRPGAGWVSVAGFAYATIGQPLLAWLSLAKGWPTPPTIDVDLLLVVLAGLLGLGGLRTLEKRNGVASK